MENDQDQGFVVNDRVPPGPYKSLKVLKFHTFKYKALRSP